MHLLPKCTSLITLCDKHSVVCYNYYNACTAVCDGNPRRVCVRVDALCCSEEHCSNMSELITCNNRLVCAENECALHIYFPMTWNPLMWVCSADLKVTLSWIRTIAPRQAAGRLCWCRGCRATHGSHLLTMGDLSLWDTWRRKPVA